MSKRLPPALARAAAIHRNLLDKKLTPHSVRAMKNIYDEAYGRVQRNLHKLVKGGQGQDFTAHQKNIILTQLKQGQKMVNAKLTEGIRPSVVKTAEKSVAAFTDETTRLHKFFTGSEIVLPVEEASVFSGVVDGVTASVMRQHAKTIAKYGERIVGDVEEELAVTLLEGGSMSDAYDTIAEAIDGEWWQGERIVRTEMSYAYNRSHLDAAKEADDELGGVYKVWWEFCDEAGRPLDERVAVDSIAMHGQAAEMDGMFTMPATAPFPTMGKKPTTEVPDSLVGLSWDQPPNRCNDRSVLMTTFKEWDLPVWFYDGGERRYLKK
jgi:hypothetical protein